MSVHIIYYQDGAKYMRPVATEQEYRQLRSSERQKQLVTQVRSGNMDAKRKLLQFNYSCLPNEDGSLKGSTRLSGSVGMDIDIDPSQMQNSEFKIQNDSITDMEAIKERILNKKDELGLLMMERSATKGYHIVFKRKDMQSKSLLQSQEQNLRWASDLLGVPYDEAAKDHTRVFFATTDSEDDLIYLSEELFRSEECKGLKGEKVNGLTKISEAINPLNSEAINHLSSYPSDYDGIPYRTLVEALSEQLGGVPVHGSRNNFLFSMACHLRYVCNDDPNWIMSVLPTYGEERSRVERTVQSAINRAQSRFMPDIVQRAISVARSRVIVDNGMGNNSSLPMGEGCGEVAPSLPKHLPKLIQLLTSNVDPMYRPAVAQAVFPPLGAHLHGVTVRYIDNSESDLGGFMSILMAKQSIGKGCVNKPIDLIMEDIKQRDDYSRDQEAVWKQQCKSCKANEKKPARPNDICVQYLMSNMTNAALVQRLIDVEDSGGKFLYTRMDEIELLDQIKATGGATASELIRLAHNQALYGQERVGTESVTGTPPLRFNFNASTTIPTGQAYFAKGLSNGTVSRLTFATIIKPADYHGIPRFGNYDERFRKELAPYIKNLNAASGLIECHEAELMAERLRKQNEELTDLSDDDDFGTLSYRANRIAYNKAMLLYIADGYKWSRSIAEFCEWSERYDLWCKMHFFGEKMYESTHMQSKVSTHGVQNMLEILPDRFSREDIIAIRRAQGKDPNPRHPIAVWTNRGYIIQDQSTLEYIKTKKYKAKHGHVKG